MHIRFCLLFYLFPLSLGALQAPSGLDLPSGRNVNFTGETFVALVWGHTNELVFGAESGSYPYLSHLDWDIKPAVLMGGSLSLNLQNIFFFNCAVATALNRHTGRMVDRDWEVMKYNEYKPWGGTHESVSDIYLTHSLLFDSNLSWRIYRNPRWHVSFLGGYKIISWGWTDKVVSADYPSSASPPPIGENGIDYIISYWIPYGGVRLGMGYSALSGSLSLVFSPFADSNDYDYHKLRGLHFYDYCHDGIYTDLVFSICRKMGKSLFISFTFEETSPNG